MKESEKIEKKIKELSDEKLDLNNKIKPIPKGRYERKFLGYRIAYNSGSLFNSIRNSMDNKENAKFINELTYEGKTITKEKMNQMRSAVRKKNEPFQKRIKEIDELIPELQKKLVETRAKEILETVDLKKDSKKNNRFHQNEGALIDEILNVVLGNDLKKYSLRKLQKSLNNNGVDIDHTTLHTRFQNEDFQLHLLANKMSRIKKVRKEEEKAKLNSFEKWFETIFMKKNFDLHNKSTPSDSKEESNEFIDNIDIDK